jgi:hypothetical protein
VTVTAVLEEHGKQSQRERLLPASFLVYLIVALSLYMPLALREVLRTVIEGLRGHRALLVPGMPVATKGAISRARTRLGWEVLATLYRRVAVPMAIPRTPGAWYRGWRLVAIDGTALSVPNTPENDAAFKKRGNISGEGAYPLVNLTALVEVGTHAVLAAACDACTTAEQTLAESLLPALTPEMLLLEDRAYTGYPWYRRVRATGAQVLCRLRSNQDFPVQRRLPDGSYLSELRPAKRTPGEPIPVRIIVYTLHGVPGAEPVYRLVTSLLDPDEAPASEVAALYHERWEVESTFDEFKTHLRGGAHVVLRSKTPELVRQEIYGVLLAHYVVRAVLHEAALQAEEDPDRLSFVHAVRVVRRKLPQAAGVSPSAADAVVPSPA